MHNLQLNCNMIVIVPASINTLKMNNYSFGGKLSQNNNAHRHNKLIFLELYNFFSTFRNVTNQIAGLMPISMEMPTNI